MRHRLSYTLAAALAAALLCNAAALAASPAATGVATPLGKMQAPKTAAQTGSLPASQVGGVLAPLSASECTALGGEVMINSICKSKQSCHRRDEDNKLHEVCLSAN